MSITPFRERATMPKKHLYNKELTTTTDGLRLHLIKILPLIASPVTPV